MLDKIKQMLLPLAVIQEKEVEKKTAPAAAESEAPSEAAQPPVIEKEIISQPALQICDYAKKGFHLDVLVAAENVVAAVTLLNNNNFFIEAITGVDWIKEGSLEVVYDFNRYDTLCRVVIRTMLDRSNPQVPTISDIYSGANWHERETHDFFGITFKGHPDLSPLLLEEDADYHPLLKDFNT